MAKQARGEVRWTSDGCAVARVTLAGKERASFRLPTCSTEEQAQERARILGEVAQKLRGRVSDERARDVLKLIAEQGTTEGLRSAMQIATDLAGGTVRFESAPDVPTFKEIGDDWTSGKLAKRYPDQIRKKRSVADDVSRLDNYVYPVLQHVPIDRVTLDLCEEVARRLPPELAVATRRNVLQLVTRILAMAVYPLRLISTNPIPKGFVPKPGPRKAKAYLYPDEDRRLLACEAVPLEYRLVWGFLTREGCRAGEAFAMTWSDIDLTRGAVKLDENKTDDPRWWALNPGVVAALSAYRQRFRKTAGFNDHVFVRPNGKPFATDGMAELLRDHLELIGLHEERPELFTTTAQRRRQRMHDLRGTFVTIALANGKSESWVADRTGHKSSQMIAEYRRPARSFAELALGELSPLDGAIPELASEALPNPSPHAKEKRRSPVRGKRRDSEQLRGRDTAPGQKRSPRRSGWSWRRRTMRRRTISLQFQLLASTRRLVRRQPSD